ncbi:MAG TPA: AMP-binding protein, partial [Tepidiformaceae bacterium]|nr:AMP-binding protein [Tepidiformaceae bacterium]
LGIREVRLTGGLVLDVPGRGPVSVPRPEDVALVLHTSGTTGRPKRVPLSHANLARSARNVATSLGLTADDRCLNVMPLFHIHGIVAAILATLSSGGSVVCTPGFDAFRFFGSLEASRATWYTAVPTMHQAIVARARAHLSTPASSSLRFVRSSSSPLPPSVMRDVEDLFGVPMVEAYGMTEASHQVCCNPLPPAVRKPGSVGVPSGVELRVVGPDGTSLRPGETGEVVIRGGSVTSGYESIDPADFTLPGGWLRTGDLGYLDDDGYLVLAGRIKELVNRGGEKISPREVEDVLITYPGVREVVVFAVPHAKLGEDIAAAIVPEPADRPLDIAALRAFAGAQLAPFKVPRQVVVVEAIPLGPTGKPQRLGMAGRLGLA